MGTGIAEDLMPIGTLERGSACPHQSESHPKFQAQTPSPAQKGATGPGAPIENADRPGRDDRREWGWL